ncbi:MAG: DUF937 domain-containing protein, partial [Saprospiraceae bacterium]
GVVEGLSKSTGMDTSSIGMMLIKLAPVVMGALGKVKSQQGLDQNGLSDLLQGTVSDNSDQNPLLAMAGRFLDKDGDGSVMDDLGNMGMGLLGGLFKK